MGRNIYGTNSMSNNVHLNFVSCYVTTAETGYRNERTISEQHKTDKFSFVGFYHTFHGKGVIKTKTNTFVVGENDLVFLCYRDLLSIAALDGEWHFYAHWFFLNNLPLPMEEVFHVEQLPNQRSRTEQIIRYLNNNDFYYLCRANGLGLAMLCEILSNTNASYHNEEPYRNSIQKIIFYINQHVDENIPISDLAAQCNVCEKHFRDIFIKQTGLSPKQFILKAKMNRAAMLLTTTSWSITEISDNLSFLSPAYFVHRFKMHFGTTPSQYRKKHIAFEPQPDQVYPNP